MAEKNTKPHNTATRYLDVVLKEDGVVVRGGRVERFRDSGDEATSLDAVVDLLRPERPVHALPRVKPKHGVNGMRWLGETGDALSANTDTTAQQ